MAQRREAWGSGRYPVLQPAGEPRNGRWMEPLWRKPGAGFPGLPFDAGESCRWVPLVQLESFLWPRGARLSPVFELWARRLPPGAVLRRQPEFRRFAALLQRRWPWLRWRRLPFFRRQPRRRWISRRRRPGEKVIDAAASRDPAASSVQALGRAALNFRCATCVDSPGDEPVPAARSTARPMHRRQGSQGPAPAAAFRVYHSR
jgi:hypothetical protein